MTPEEQLERWVAGDPVHNDEADECCPDFSYCVPGLLRPAKERKAFRAAGPEERELTLVSFFAAFADWMHGPGQAKVQS